MVEDENGVEFEVEAKRRYHSSWHPSQISLCSGGRGLSIKFGGPNWDDDYMVYNSEDAFSCIRFPSIPLQHHDCCYIDQGNHVVAVYQSHTTFFDAIVHKVLRVRHSKRASCRCSFIVNLPQNLTLTLPSSSIKKLSQQSIKTHPLVAAFIQNSPCSSPLQYSTVFGDTDEAEIDLHGLLARQIEQITTLAHLSGVDSLGVDGQPKLIASDKESKLHVDVNCRQNHLRRSGRMQNKLQTKTEDPSTTTVAPSFIEEYGENRSPLNPLAARAVLASLVSKVPQETELINHKERKPVSILDYTAHLHVSFDVNSMTISGGSDSYNVNNTDYEHGKLVGNIEVRSETKKGASGQKFGSVKSRGELVMGGCHKYDNSVVSGVDPSQLSSVRDEEPTQLLKTGRLTRSASKLVTVMSNGEVKSRTPVEDGLFTRLARSGAHKRNGSSVGEVIEGLQDPVRKPRETSTARKNKSGASDIEDKRTPDEKTKVTICTRTTRVIRSALREGSRNLDGKIKEALPDKSGTDLAQPDYGQKDDCLPESKASVKKRASLPASVEIKFVGSNKKQNRSNVGGRLTTAVEEPLSNVENQYKDKAISLRNQPIRFSPRLRFG